jgi:hypothetical protein
MRRYQSFDPSPAAPAEKLPAGACDCHFHVFGDRARYPVLPGIEHDMPEATMKAAQRMHNALGVERGVICASTVNGSNHDVILDALALAGPGYRACALYTVLDEQPDAYLQRLHAAGVRGARFNLLRVLNRMPSPERMARAIAQNTSPSGTPATPADTPATPTPAERRLERLATPTVADNRISSGCINVPAEFFEKTVLPVFGTRRAMVYILPEQKSLEEVFGTVTPGRILAGN